VALGVVRAVMRCVVEVMMRMGNLLGGDCDGGYDDRLFVM
jgi:hypothetical protein